jgi:hypothetical protein
MTIHETRTTLAPAEVIDRARTFFTLIGTPYAAFVEVETDGFLKLHLEVGEIVVSALPQGDVTVVRGSASRGAHLLTRFLTSLGWPQDVRQTTHRAGSHVSHAARVQIPKLNITTTSEAHPLRRQGQPAAA